MTALTISAQPGNDTALRPVPWRRMAWVTWRQHRLTLAGVAGLLGALAAYLLFTGLPMHHAYAAVAACHPAGSLACSNAIVDFDNAHWSTAEAMAVFLQVVPALIGAFSAAPILARELETGTFRFTWTQGFGRARWTVATLAPLALAVTVAVAMFLSAINALTLSPALCGVLLRPQHGPRRGVMGSVMRSIDRVRDAYGSAVARIVRISVIGLVVVAVCALGVVGLTKITPTGFLPEDDQGALFVVAQLPGGASVERTSEVIRQAEAIVKEEPAVADYTSAIGLNFIDNYSQSNAAFMVLSLKPFDERKDASLGAQEVIKRLGAKLRQIQGGIVVPLAPPPISGRAASKRTAGRP